MNQRQRIVTIILVAAVALSLPAAARAADEVKKGGPMAVRGVFALSDGTRRVAKSVLNHPDIAGVSLRACWADLEPEEGKFDWLFDADLERAARAGKRVTLSVATGEATPAWVYEAGARAFTYQVNNPYRPAHGKEKRIPLAWDAVFLKKWAAFVKALGERYGKNEAVVLIHMAGPAESGSEMYLPKSRDDKAQWERLGYTKEKFVDAWRPVIDAYARAFPEKVLALDVALPVWDDGAAEDVIAYAYAKLGKRFAVQHNALAAKTREATKVHRWVAESRDKATVGFQLLCPVTPRGRFNDNGKRFGGTLKEGFKIGLDAGASYIEIYPIDLENEATAQDIHHLAEALRKQR